MKKQYLAWGLAISLSIGTIFGNSGVSWAFENTNQDKTANVEKEESSLWDELGLLTPSNAIELMTSSNAATENTTNKPTETTGLKKQFTTEDGIIVEIDSQDVILPENTQIQVKKVEVLNGNLKKPLAGAYFKVYKTKKDALDQQNEVCQIGPTKLDGTAVSEKFHRTQEAYYVRESQAPTGYVLSGDIREVNTEVDKIAQTEEFKNERATTSIQILKTAKDGTTPLKGAQFRLYATPECIKPILKLPLTGGTDGQRVKSSRSHKSGIT